MSKVLNIVLLASAADNRFIDELSQDLQVRAHTLGVWIDKASAWQVQEQEIRGTDRVLFEHWRERVAMADLIVAQSPLGMESACLIGIAHCVGVPVAVLGTPLCGLAVRGSVSHWCPDLDAVLQVVNELADDGDSPYLPAA